MAAGLRPVVPRLCESCDVGTSMTRASLIWFVAAVVTGAVAAGLHLLGSEVGGNHDSVALAVAAWLFTALAGLMVYRGIMTAAGEQDEAERRGVAAHRGPDHLTTTQAPDHEGVGRPEPTDHAKTPGPRPR